jgi:hypothetical protein
VNTNTGDGVGIIKQVVVHVDSTASGTATTIHANSPFDFVNVSPAAENLGTIQGPLTVAGVGLGYLTLHDENNIGPFQYTLTASSVSRQFVASISYSGLSNITLYGGHGLGRAYEVTNTAGGLATTTIYAANRDDIVDVDATTGSLIVNLLNTHGNAIVNVSPTAQNLDTIQGNVTVNGQCVDGQCFGTVNLEDQLAPAGRSYTLTSASLAWRGTASVGYTNIASLILNGTAFDDTVTVQSLPANSVTLHGSGGSNNTLIGPDGNNIWQLAQPSGEEGTLDTTLVFDSFGSLIGGQQLDRFVVPDGAYIPEFLSGVGGATGGNHNTLDLSAFTSPLTEHIMTSVYGGNVTTTSGGTITTVVRAFALCQNVIGGLSDDHFIFNQGFGLTTVDGGGGNNTIDDSPYSRTFPGWAIEILGHNSGLVSGQISTFNNIQNLIGTQTDDRFGFRGTAHLDGTINGQGGTNSLEYTESAASVSVNLQAATASYLNLQGGSTPQPGGFSNIQRFVGGPGTTNTLIGANATNTWTITGLNNGTVNGYSFTGFQDLTGGTMADTFVFQRAGSIAGTVDGDGGTNALDYSQYTGNITVDLALNLASLVNQAAAGSVFNIANVTGSIGNDLLVGDANANVLAGGTGQNVLIGGAGVDTLDASRATSDNILIGGRTDWDMNVAALNAIFAEWTRTDLGFSDRRSDLLNGTNSAGATPLNVVNGQLILLTPATNPTSSNGTVHSDGKPNTLIGGTQIDPATGQRLHNWFLYDSYDMVINFDMKSDRKNIVR